MPQEKDSGNFDIHSKCGKNQTNLLGKEAVNLRVDIKR